MVFFPVIVIIWVFLRVVVEFKRIIDEGLLIRFERYLAATGEIVEGLRVGHGVFEVRSVTGVGVLE